MENPAKSTVENGTQNIDRNGTTVEKNGIKITITPNNGPTGTTVLVLVNGLPLNNFLPFASVSFKDKLGNPGNSLGQDGQIDTRTADANGFLRTQLIIPKNVLVAAFPGAQNPSKLVPTAIGMGAIVLSYIDPIAYQNKEASDRRIEIPFEVK